MAASAPKTFYQATTDGRVVLIRGEGLGGKRRSNAEEEKERESERGTGGLYPHSNHRSGQPEGG